MTLSLFSQKILAGVAAGLPFGTARAAEKHLVLTLISLLSRATPQDAVGAQFAFLAKNLLSHGEGVLPSPYSLVYGTPAVWGRISDSAKESFLVEKDGLFAENGIYVLARDVRRLLRHADPGADHCYLPVLAFCGTMMDALPFVGEIYPKGGWRRSRRDAAAFLLDPFVAPFVAQATAAMAVAEPEQAVVFVDILKQVQQCFGRAKGQSDEQTELCLAAEAVIAPLDSKTQAAAVVAALIVPGAGYKGLSLHLGAGAG